MLSGRNRPPLAIRNVMHSWRRSAAAIAGMAFAIVMVFLQLGFLEAVKITAAVNFDQLDFDILLLSPNYEQFYDPGSFPRSRLRQADALPGVQSARPLYAGLNLWRCPPYPLRDASTSDASRDPLSINALERWWLGDERPRALQRREMLVLGVDLDQPPFSEPIQSQLAAATERLRLRDRVLLNERSNPDFGWDLVDQFDGWEIGTLPVTVVGGFSLERSFGADASALCNAATYERAFGQPGLAAAAVNFGVIRTEPGQRDAVLAALADTLPPDVQPWSRRDIYRFERDYWVRHTATGKIFSFGVIVTMLVALIVIYQVLSNDVRNRLPEYATLKAMGYTVWGLGRSVLLQAIIYALLAYLPAVLLSLGIYRVTASLAHIPMVMTVRNLALVLALTVLISVGSGYLVVRRLRWADPADLF